MIRQPSDVQTKAKKIRMLIAGYPGIGKTTLGLSAPRALHIDIDAGIDRIEPRYIAIDYGTSNPMVFLDIKPSSRCNTNNFTRRDSKCLRAPCS